MQTFPAPATIGLFLGAAVDINAECPRKEALLHCFIIVNYRVQVRHFEMNITDMFA